MVLNEFLTLIIFVLPGLMSFNLIKLFGLYPTAKHKNNEAVMLSAVMWIPINIFVIGFYTIIAYLGKKSYGFDIPYIYSIETLNELSDNLLFVLYYALFSIIGAYYLAKFISKNMYIYFLTNINEIRNRNGKASLSRDPTVWENAFSGYDAQIVRMKIKDKTYIGEIKTVSSNIENGKDLILQCESHWTNIMEKYEIDIEDVYIDTKSNLVIEIFHRDQCIKAQDLYEEKYMNIDK